MAGERGKNMSMPQFQDVLRVIMTDHAWGKGHWIKYVRPHFDTRTQDFYGVSLDGAFGHKDFFVVNENRDRDLTEWVMDFLCTDPQAAGWQGKVSETA